MTRMGTILSTSLITLGIMLAMFAWAAGPPLRQQLPTAAPVSTSSHSPATVLVQIASTRMRTRFVAIDAVSSRSASPQPTEAVAANAALPIARKHVAKKTSAPKDKKLLQRPAPAPQPQSASLQWPWASWFK
jgi:hypothetical protein